CTPYLKRPRPRGRGKKGWYRVDIIPSPLGDSLPGGGDIFLAGKGCLEPQFSKADSYSCRCKFYYQLKGAEDSGQTHLLHHDPYLLPQRQAAHRPCIYHSGG